MPKARQGGRPSREDSEKIGGRILDAATDLFLTEGFGATSIEALAARLRISKRTFYHRFPDKAALFAAVVHRIITKLRPAAGVPALPSHDIAATLELLATLILQAALQPQALALHRLITSESARFPEIAGMVAREGSSEEAIALIAGALQRAAGEGRIAIDDADFAARQFLQMVIALPQRGAMGMGAPVSARELAAWPRKVVDLFLHGCRAREATPHRRPRSRRMS